MSGGCGGKAMGVFLVATILVGLSDRPKSNDDALRLANVEIQLIKRGRSRVEAKISNHNGFAVFNVIISCDFKDRFGNVLASGQLTITDAIQGNGIRTIRNLDFGAWPTQAKVADCLPLEGTRLPD